MNQNSRNNTNNEQENPITLNLLTKERATESNAIQIPEISLPKGGGALKGIDEKFKVNAANGTAGFSIPLPITPGRNGFSPTLNLSYNSGGGNSLFGLGWSIDFPIIQRKTDKRLPKYTDGDNEDVFMFSGAEDLVPYLRDDGLGNFQPLESENNEYTIKRYRPRIESDFARIEKIYHPSYGVYWKVTTKDNSVIILGRSVSARVVNPEDESQIFQWLPEFSYDDKGNWIKYDYKKEDSINVPDVVYEKNRNNGSAVFTNTYLKSVKYGNRIAYFADPSMPYDPQPPVDNDYFFELVLDYGDHDADNPLPESNGQWDYRTDAFSSYRSGFEIRTNRLCKRILMFHHFPLEQQFIGTSEEESFGSNYLVRSLDLKYSPSSINDSVRSETTYLESIIQSGYIRKPQPDGSYSKKSLPSLEFTYERLNWNTEVRTIRPENIMNAPVGLTNNYQWVDLFGEGISGILTEQGDGWFYKNNLGDVEENRDLVFTVAKKVAPKPSFSGLSNEVLSIQDLASTGEKQVVVSSSGLKGYFELTQDNDWKPFQSFEQMVTIDLQDPNTRLIDLNGDGQPELVVTEENAFTWYPANGKHGYLPAEHATKTFDEEKGPAIVFADQEQSIFLADMSGDGLTDIVRIRNGEICYWANKGYGKFSTKVTMGNAPLFDTPDLFNPKYLHLADVSGTGVTDLIYLGKNKFKAFINLSGNAWSDAHEIEPFFPIDSNSRLSVVDLLGTGTSCIVWSSDLPAHANAPMRYMDLMNSKKPHVLTHYKNNFGKESSIEYKSSTYYYLKDKLEGKPWITKLPFPVQVVSKMVVEEKITDVRFISEYRYHHGYYDHYEREFRGFGMVEQIDSENYLEWSRLNATNRLEQSEELYQKPVLTKTWYHTGAFLDRERILTHFKAEYWYEEYNRRFPDAQLNITEPELADAKLSDEIIALPGEEYREALRACKGMMLRQEVFALDALENPTDLELQLQMKPYTVATRNCNVQLLQPRQKNEFGVYIVTESEAITINYERNETDYRLAHTLNTKIDDLGNILESASVVYGRQQANADTDFQSIADSVTDFSEDVLNDNADQMTQLQNAFANNMHSARDEQTKTHIIYTQNSFAKYNDGVSDFDDLDLPYAYRLRLPYETKTYELTGFSPLEDIFQLPELEDALSTAIEIGYHETTSSRTEKRLIEHIKSKYLNDNLNELDLGFYDTLGLPYENYQLAFTPELVTNIYSRQDGAELQTDGIEVSGSIKDKGNYTEFNNDGNLWIRSGLTHFKDHTGEAIENVRNRFYSPLSFEDPYGAITAVTYDTETFARGTRNNDGYYLYIKDTTDAIGNKVQIDVFNYRTMSPTRMIDLNANPSSVLKDELGLVKAMAIEGNGVFADESRTSVNIIQPADSLSGLKEYTEDTESDQITLFFESATTNSTNTSQLRQAGNALLQEASARFVYDFTRYQNTGSQPTAVASVVREEHFAANNNSNIQCSFEYSDGLGNVAMTKVQAESGLAFYMEDGEKREANTGEELRWIGNGRTVLNNKGNPVKQFEPYFSTNFLYEDAPDLVEIGVTPILYYDSIGRLIRTEFPDGTFSKVEFDSWKQHNFDTNDTVLESAWYHDRINNRIDAELIAQGKNPVKEREAAQKAAAHTDTSTSVFLDSLGRPVLTMAHNGKDAEDMDRLYTTFIALDIEGNAKGIRDVRGNTVMSYNYNMLGHRLYENSMDAGEKWTLNNVMGQPVHSWDSKEQVFTTTYDATQRPIAMYLYREGRSFQIQNITYGESAADSFIQNLRGQPHRTLDSAGLFTTTSFDFKGNALEVQKQFSDIRDQEILDWSEGSPTSGLEEEVFTKITAYDALGRMVRLYNWHSTSRVTVYEPAYNERGILESEVHITDATKTATGHSGGRRITAVSVIQHNEKGQRLRIRFANGTTTRYHYDTETYRLIQLRTTRTTSYGTLPILPSNLSNPNVLQNLYYTYDAAGNITEIEDDAYQPVFFNNQFVEPRSRYTYDALSRLIIAEGRENHQANQAPTASENEPTRVNFPISDQALRNYTQTYHYDPAGNILRMRHITNPSTERWTRQYEYASDSNRLLHTWTGSDRTGQVTYRYDEHGNMLNYNNTPEEFLPEWDYANRVHHISLGGGGDAYYQYDSGLERTRKHIVGPNGTVEERLYLSGMEVYRRWQSSQLVEEIETHHLFVDDQRALLVENVISTNNTNLTEGILYRYQYSNHLGSVGLELDHNAEIISYEEYHPYGTVAYQARNQAISTVAKCYRYTGMERDSESGLNYHSARYYLPWLGRWLSADPIGVEDGINLYRYANSNPVKYFDKNGQAVVLAIIGIVAVATLAYAAFAPRVASAPAEDHTPEQIRSINRRNARSEIAYYGSIIPMGSGSLRAASAIGAVISVGEQAVEDAIVGEASSPSDYAAAAAGGALAGSAGGLIGNGMRRLLSSTASALRSGARRVSRSQLGRAARAGNLLYRQARDQLTSARTAFQNASGPARDALRRQWIRARNHFRSTRGDYVAVRSASRAQRAESLVSRRIESFQQRINQEAHSAFEEGGNLHAQDILRVSLERIQRSMGTFIQTIRSREGVFRGLNDNQVESLVDQFRNSVIDALHITRKRASNASELARVRVELDMQPAGQTVRATRNRAPRPYLFEDGI